MLKSGDWGEWGDWGKWGDWDEWAEFRNFMNTCSQQQQEQQLHESSVNRLYECKPVKTLQWVKKNLESLKAGLMISILMK